LQTYSAVLVSKKGVVVGIITKADLLRMLWGEDYFFKYGDSFNWLEKIVFIWCWGVP
jgi:hypothetical protein